ncbi:hypothetical protein Naga_100012g82 [Nannochloropsis gaditana]|uniref:Uncharacterized protein n=1 Tax=Nannochloropsis gaditana TaxID=72520 RepID=W7T528_9STRA|nr:hypothetical protein Naga_100012g82 [Nannochloropsis gaditana]
MFRNSGPKWVELCSQVLSHRDDVVLLLQVDKTGLITPAVAARRPTSSYESVLHRYQACYQDIRTYHIYKISNSLLPMRGA